MTEWIDGVVKYSETELKLLGLDQTPIGPAIIEFITKPLTPISEKDFVDDRCVRYPYIYKSGEKYYNDRAVVFKKSYDDLSSQYIYQGQQRSKQEITLPYILREEIVLIP
jgi:hypothetical protein